MTPTAFADELTALGRLQLREDLQDLWRVEVRRLTLLSLAMYDDLDAEEPTSLGNVADDPTRVDAALGECRDLLTRLEAAMRRLDDGSYGRCTRCGTPISYAQLSVAPLATACQQCPT